MINHNITPSIFHLSFLLTQSNTRVLTRGKNSRGTIIIINFKFFLILSSIHTKLYKKEDIKKKISYYKNF